MGTNVLPSYIAVDGGKIAIEVKETGHKEVDTMVVNCGLCLPIWVG